MSPKTLVMLLVAITLLHSPLGSWQTQAENRTWQGGNDFWDVNAKWSGGLQPFRADNAIVPSGMPEVRFLEQITDLTNAGTIQVNGTLEMFGTTVDNNGTINVGDGSAGVTNLIISSPFVGDVIDPALRGSGEVVLQNSDSTGNSSATLRGSFFDDMPIVHSTSHTIRGEGSITGAWANNGLIRADETTGDSFARLRLSGSMTNNGMLRSSPTGFLEFRSSTIIDGGSGQMMADTQPIVFGGLPTIEGGSLESVNGGVYELAVDGNNVTTLSGVTVNAPINNINTEGNNSILGTSAGIINNSTITLDGQGTAISSLGFSEPGLLGGTGEVVLVSGDPQSFIGRFPSFPAEFTQGANHTIRGAGLINSTLINNGTIRAEPGTNSNVLLLGGNLFQGTNNGLIEATAGTTIRFSSNAPLVQGPTGRVSALDGATIELGGNSITGGLLESIGTGRFLVTNSSTVANLTNAAAIDVPTFTQLKIDGGGLTNDGIITLNSDSGTGFSILSFTEDTLLDGTGEIVLKATALERAAGGVVGLVVTQSAGHTIRGDGDIRINFINNGRIEGDSATELIRLTTGRLSGIGTLSNFGIGPRFSATHAPGDPSAGNPIAIAPVEGSYEIFVAGVLEIELAGLTPGTEHDQLSSTGTVNIDAGALDVSLIDLGNGYFPAAGDQFEIITSANNDIIGDFRVEKLPETGFGRAITWQPIDYSNPRSVTLEIAAIDFLSGDFDMDGELDGADVDALVGDIADMNHTTMFDLTGDGMVDQADLAEWLRVAGAVNLPSGNPYLPADANLDGVVDASDFNRWNANKFTLAAAWTLGDFDANGAIDVTDFNTWNDNKFQSADGSAAATVPEPSGWLMGCFLALALRRTHFSLP